MRGKGARTTLASLIAVTTAMVTMGASAETISLRMGSGHPVQAVETNRVAHGWFVPELKRRAKAVGITVNVREHHAGTVAKVKEVLEATRDGLLDIGLWYFVFEPTNAFLQSFNFSIPFNSPDPRQVTLAMRKTRKKFPEMMGIYEKKFNQKVLAVSCVSNYGLGTSFAWENFSDLKGHKIAGAGANLNWIKGAATPVSSNLNEAYNAIQMKVYEGYIISLGLWHTFKLHEVGKYFTKTDFGAMAIHAMTINLDTWKKLPKRLRDILTKMGAEYEDITAEECITVSIEGEKKLLAAGSTVRQISSAAKKKWCEAVKDVPNKFAQDANKRGLPGTAVMRYYIATLKDMGYKFPCNYVIN